MNIPDLSGVHKRQVESVSAVNVLRETAAMRALPAYIVRTIIPLPNNMGRI